MEFLLLCITFLSHPAFSSLTTHIHMSLFFLHLFFCVVLLLTQYRRRLFCLRAGCSNMTYFFWNTFLVRSSKTNCKKNPYCIIDCESLVRIIWHPKPREPYMVNHQSEKHSYSVTSNETYVADIYLSVIKSLNPTLFRHLSQQTLHFLHFAPANSLKLLSPNYCGL